MVRLPDNLGVSYNSHWVPIDPITPYSKDDFSLQSGEKVRGLYGRWKKEDKEGVPGQSDKGDV